jgi:hypothetical protein
MSWNIMIALALIAAGAWATWLRIKRRRAAREMAGWRTVTGEVLSHSIEESVTTDSSNDREWHYDPRLRYAYEVGGTRHESERISLDGVSFGSRKRAQAWLDKRPVGSSVNVHLNPADPADSVLETNVAADWWVPLFFFALGIAVALGLFGG